MYTNFVLTLSHRISLNKLVILSADWLQQCLFTGLEYWTGLLNSPKIV